MQVLKPALPFATGSIKREIQQGISHLYITNAGNLYVVLRPEGNELVVVAVAGRNLFSAQQAIVDFGRNHGFATLRFHTRSPEHLKKGLSGLNYYHDETRKHFIGGDEYIFKVRLGHVYF